MHLPLHEFYHADLHWIIVSLYISSLNLLVQGWTWTHQVEWVLHVLGLQSFAVAAGSVLLGVFSSPPESHLTFPIRHGLCMLYPQPLQSHIMAWTLTSISDGTVNQSQKHWEHLPIVTTVASGFRMQVMSLLYWLNSSQGRLRQIILPVFFLYCCFFNNKNTCMYSFHCNEFICSWI